jgi:hypothetical protein
VPMILAGAVIIVMAWRANRPAALPNPDQGTS